MLCNIILPFSKNKLHFKMVGWDNEAVLLKIKEAVGILQNLKEIFYTLGFWENVVASLTVAFILHLCKKFFSKNKQSKNTPPSSSVSINGDGNVRLSFCPRCSRASIMYLVNTTATYAVIAS